jgi:hypothetical protein
MLENIHAKVWKKARGIIRKVEIEVLEVFLWRKDFCGGQADFMPS